jgi:hypothetical protein
MYLYHSSEFICCYCCCDDPGQHLDFPVIDRDSKPNKASWQTLFGIEPRPPQQASSSSKSADLTVAGGKRNSRPSSPQNPQNPHAAFGHHTAPMSLTMPVALPHRHQHPFTIVLSDVISSNSRQAIPNVLIQCCEYIRTAKDGSLLETEGLFRVGGMKANVDAMLKRFMESNDAVDVDLEAADIHDVCGVIKTFFRCMSEPLLTYKQYDAFIAAGQLPSESSEQLTALQEIVHALPAHHQPTLQYILSFLHTVSTHSEVNKMPAKNLAVVFAPTLCKPQNETPLTMLNDTKYAINALSALISHSPGLMQAPPVSPTSKSETPTSSSEVDRRDEIK